MKLHGGHKTWKLRMLFARGTRYVSVQDLENMFKEMATNEENPKFRTRMFELVETIRSL